MKLVLISDTHGMHSHVKLPEGDVLIHAGDISNMGTVPEITSFLHWFEKQPHRHKIFIAGNHDFLFEKEPRLARSLVPASVIYLEDSGVEIDGLHFWGSPWTPAFHNWAFQLRHPEHARFQWGLIPKNTDILITHGPPLGKLDAVRIERVGCFHLAWATVPIEPKLHVFGHIHESYGVEHQDTTGTCYANAALCPKGPVSDGLRAPIVTSIGTTEEKA